VLKLQGHRTRVVALFLNPFNTLQLYSLSKDGLLVLWDVEEGKELFRVAGPRSVAHAAPSLVEEGVIYLACSVGLDSYKFAELYAGLGPRTVSEQQTREALGRELEASSTSLMSDEEAKCCLLGTGVYGPDGKEYLQDHSWSEEELRRRMDQVKLQAISHPMSMQVSPGGVRIYVDLKYIGHHKQANFRGLYTTKKFLFYCFAEHIGTISCQYHSKGPKLDPPMEIACVALHPQEDIVALGMDDGHIYFWRYSTLGEISTHLKESYHWHSQRCTSLQFTEDATYLISGGKEAVLVIWQLYTGRRHYIPALGATITRLAISPNSKHYAVSTAANCIHLINSVTSTIHKTIASIVRDKRKHLRDEPALVPALIEPREGFVVTEGAPGVLQFYNPITDRHGKSLVVARNLTNVINPLVATITQIGFTAQGNWLVTVDVRPLTPDKYEFITTLKFWKFSEGNQTYELVTQVTPPHEEITSLAVCPATGIVVTAGSEGKFMIWETVTLESDGSNRSVHSWRCRSVGYYRNRPAGACKFSRDGSILAISYGSVITLWNPNSLVLKKTLAFPVTDFDIRFLDFIAHTPFLVSANSSHLCVWNLLKLQIEWFTELTVIQSIQPDPVLPRFSVLIRQIPFCPSVFSPPTKEDEVKQQFEDTLEKYKNVILRRKFKKRPAHHAMNNVRTIDERLNINPNTATLPPAAKKRITEAFELPTGRSYLLTFEANSITPLAITELEYTPRTPLMYLPRGDDSRFQEHSDLPSLAYLHVTTVVIIGEPEFIKHCRDRSVSASKDVSKTARKSIFSEIYGELKEATQQLEDTVDDQHTSTLASKLSILESPSHLIPSVNILFPSFMKSMLTPSARVDKEQEVHDSETDSMDVEEEDASAQQTSTDALTESSVHQRELVPDFDIQKNSDYAALSKLISSMDLKG